MVKKSVIEKLFGWKAGFFWYSSKQRMVARNPRSNYCKLLSGKIVEYTEWKHSLNPSCWDDAKFLGFGWYHHATQR